MIVTSQDVSVTKGKMLADMADEKASDAQISADNAQANATTALSTLADFASDSVLTPLEKIAVRQEWLVIDGEHQTIIDQATKYGLSTASYTASYNSLNSYLYGNSGVLNDMNRNNPVTPVTIQSRFTNYYNAKIALLKAITDSAKNLADNAQITANDALTSANGKSVNYYGATLPAGSNIKENDTWFKQNANGVCIGIYQYKNNTWVQAKLDQNALTVVSLSALSANLGNVTAGNINGVNITGTNIEGSQVKSVGSYTYTNSTTGTTVNVSNEVVLNNGIVRIAEIGSSLAVSLTERGFTTTRLQNGDTSWKTGSSYLDFRSGRGTVLHGGTGLNLYSPKTIDMISDGQMTLMNASISESSYNPSSRVVLTRDTIWIYASDGLYESDFTVGKDGTGGRVSSSTIHARTYSSAANVCITSAGTLGRSTSARKYKLNIQDSSDVIEKAKSSLSINPAKWFDKTEVETLANAMTNDSLDEIEESIKPIMHHGFIADEWHEKGLTEVVSYNAEGNVEGLAYDRISMYHHVLLQQHEQTISEQQQQIDSLRQEIADIKALLNN